VLNARAGRTIIQSDFPSNFAAAFSQTEEKKLHDDDHRGRQKNKNLSSK
jgi:hypothetical protein